MKTSCKNCGAEFTAKLDKGKWQSCCSKRCAFGWAGKVSRQKREGKRYEAFKLDDLLTASELYRSGKTLKEIEAVVGHGRHNVARALKAVRVYDFNRVPKQKQRKDTWVEDLIVEEYRREDRKLRQMDNLWSFHPCVSQWMNHWADKSKSRARANKRWMMNRNNPHFRARKSLSLRLWKFTTSQGIQRWASTMKLLGCDWPTFKHHIESKFTDGMTWENYGKWEMDHIKPCSAFDLAKPQDQRECFHYTNLQPLWKFDNISKGGINRLRNRKTGYLLFSSH